MSQRSSRWLAFVLVGVVVGAGIGLAGGYLAFGVVSAPHKPKVILAIQPTEAAAEIQARAKTLEEFLEARVNVDIEIYVPTTYAAVVEAIRFGNAHIAFMGAWPAFLANKLAGAEVALAEIREVIIEQVKREAPFYFSTFVVLKDSPYQTLAELRGKRGCFPSPISTSGYVFPVARLVQLGLLPQPTQREADPKSFFAEVFFAGGYAQCWEALKRGQVDVGVIAGDVSEKLYREVTANTRVLAQQGPIPSHAVVFSRALKEPLRSQLEQALLQLNVPDHRDSMRALMSALFVGFERRTTAEHLTGLQTALQLTGLRFTERLG